MSADELRVKACWRTSSEQTPSVERLPVAATYTSGSLSAPEVANRVL